MSLVICQSVSFALLIIYLLLENVRNSLTRNCFTNILIFPNLLVCAYIDDMKSGDLLFVFIFVCFSCLYLPGRFINVIESCVALLYYNCR